ncbi:gliding motility-associated C-terminal domain-containing protein [Hymenobacter lapidiphilus]|uniref:Gliding motility-associated C-terminal domain-containing protein n=1 Tax=Hymenobacter lapidiphilus TaxID=2608003 RepID=A0A7Y7PM72_9BACT|nr:gliding motility-associated C-terminal domain-containing protein [Hymenobacter lapidiphilus]NVO30353.1 gliding motility-associated C-terminal domain-containing protein [Hymenobacter lapidiphilus]
MLSALSTSAQGPLLVRHWDKTYSGNAGDNLQVIRPTPDGGYLLGGSSSSNAGLDKSQDSRGSDDYWLVKIDAAGTKQWDKTYGGTGPDWLSAIITTPDGGYLIGGSSASGANGDKSQASFPSEVEGVPSWDYWVIRLDAQGNKLWDRTLGGNQIDMLNCLALTAEGGFLLGGYSYSTVSGQRTQPRTGQVDGWVVGLDAQGNTLWDAAYGRGIDSRVNSIAPTPDGLGYVLGNTCYQGNNSDYWLVQITPGGEVVWNQAYGGTSNDNLTLVQATADGGYLAGGWSYSDTSGQKTHPNRGGPDYWVLKVDAAGQPQWDQTLGGNGFDYLRAALPTADGGYLLGGFSESGVSGDKTQPVSAGTRPGAFDYWAVKLRSDGSKQWDLTFGGPETDNLYGLAATADNGFLLAGTSSSGVTLPDKTQACQGISDFWLLKIAPPPPGLVSISGPPALCPGATALLQVTTTPTATGLRWNTGATTATISVGQPGMYTVTATFPGGEPVTAQHSIAASTVVPLPVEGLGPDTTLCTGASVMLYAPLPLRNGLRYQWSDGSSGPTLRVQQAGTYTLEISNGCSSRLLTKRVAVASCLFVPNVITPNADGRNDYFVLKGVAPGSCKLQLFNRWGHQVFVAGAYQNDWGAEAAAGTYYYILQQAGFPIYKGWLQVIR